MHAPIIKTVPKPSKPPFQYCDYAPSFKEFMESVKKLEVGREIKIGDVLKILPKEEMPEDLKGYYREEDISVDKHNNDTEYQVDTVALNVDELV